MPGAGLSVKKTFTESPNFLEFPGPSRFQDLANVHHLGGNEVDMLGSTERCMFHNDLSDTVTRVWAKSV